MLFVLLYFVAIFGASTSLPSGPPTKVCQSMMPDGKHTLNAREQTTPNPWMIDTSDFGTSSSGIVYTPGRSYTITFRPVAQGTVAPTFRGFFIQGRTQLQNSMVGSFSNPDTHNVLTINNRKLEVTRLSSCTPSSVGVTHSNSARIDISVPLNFTWTAPAAGTGPIQFRYTVVQNTSTWWASDVSAVVQESTSEAVTQLQGIGLLTVLNAAVASLAIKTLL